MKTAIKQLNHAANNTEGIEREVILALINTLLYGEPYHNVLRRACADLFTAQISTEQMADYTETEAT